ncbi:MAG: aldo/keto reductase [Anaerolineae bacterium]|nr:aldo/keto reductase [Anaerolineae bacterium]
MQTTTFGSSNLTVTRMGLGLAAAGRPGYINLKHSADLKQNYDVQAMQHNAFAVMDAAYDAGIRYYDAARSYGKAEEFLANWLRGRQFPALDVVVGSKWGYTYTADWQVEAEKHEIKEHSVEVLHRQWNETQEFLADYLNLYQIHSATLESGVLENPDVLNELARLKHDGLLVGLSVSGSKQHEVIRKALDTQIDGVLLFDSVQATWNILERSAGLALAEAHDAGMGVIIKEALANGRLTDKNNHPAFADSMRNLREQAQRLETSLDALALAAVLAHDWADVVLSGAATAEQLQSNVRAFDVAWDSEAEAALVALMETPENYWQTRANLDWN